MVTTSRRNEVQRELHQLDAADQQRVMEFAHAFEIVWTSRYSWPWLTPFAGTLSDESVDDMMAAIEDGCEGIRGRAYESSHQDDR